MSLYYWLTPLFWALDALFGANLRTAALEGSPGMKIAYYLLCMACGAAIRLRPQWTRIVGLGEASFNLLLLVLGIFIPYYRLVDRLAAGGIVDANPFGTEQSISLVLAGAIWVVSFRMHAAGGRALGGSAPFR